MADCAQMAHLLELAIWLAFFAFIVWVLLR